MGKSACEDALEHKILTSRDVVTSFQRWVLLKNLIYNVSYNKKTQDYSAKGIPLYKLAKLIGVENTSRYFYEILSLIIDSRVGEITRIGKQKYFKLNKDKAERLLFDNIIYDEIDDLHNKTDAYTNIDWL